METIDFQEFEVRLQEMKEALEANIVSLKNEMQLIVLDENIDDSLDMASLESDTTNHRVVLKQQEDELNEVVHAIAKIKNGTYGICEESGDRIMLERLRVEPHARYCIDDAKKIQK